ncbi:hypothetical protein [Frankia sp. Cj3]|uniref:hypothetical protein n=1 Tax=Frankia sp. Cj3 TaxID=2880976 RepID=UPI001EF5E29A|nr:hypothetical protein [Frankia sp. Cj3]
MEQINHTLRQRYDALARQRNQVDNKQPASSIEETVKPSSSSIELPAVIDDLIDNKMYRNKFKSLIRRGHLQDLLELAELAAKKDKPSHWFSMVTAKRRWEQTLKFLAKAREIARTAAEVIKRLPVPSDAVNVVYKACWRVSGHAVRLAITAAETGRDPFKYFAWLVWKGHDKQPTGATA